jgi:hypothetical protein
MTTELFINKDISKTDETLHDEGIFKCEEVSDPKTINIKQYLNTNNLSVNNINFVIKSP